MMQTLVKNLSVEKWRFRAFKDWRKKLEELERKLKEADP
jgi:hypothetical protein